MKKYPKPRLDKFGFPEYWHRSNYDFQYMVTDNPDDFKGNLFLIDKLEERVIYLELFQKEFQKFSRNYKYELKEILDLSVLELEKLRKFIGDKKFKAINRNDDFKLINVTAYSEIYDVPEIAMRGPLDFETVVMKYIQLVDDKVYCKAIELIYKSERDKNNNNKKTQKSCLEEAIKFFKMEHRLDLYEQSKFSHWRKRFNL